MSKWLAAAAAVVMGTGCNYGASSFHCDTDSQCGADGKCELSYGGLCSFPTNSPDCPSGRQFGDLSGDQSGKCVGSQPPGDAGIDTPVIPPDAQACFGTDLVKICLDAAPTTPLMINNATTIDTTTSPMCMTVKSGGSNYCVLAATTISIGAKLRATGAKPLVLLASDSINVSALIDVGSHRGENPETGAGADPAACGPGTAPTMGGGGAGGSFAGLGGAGGVSATGGTGGVPAAVASITDLRGGCAGQDGEGAAPGGKGHGGGAVFLIAGNTINVSGGINAAGESGDGGKNNTSGGGGAGAGGMIGFEAPTITGNSLILANGGGGGEGSGETPTGSRGSDPSGITAASGGSGLANGGDGGAGSAGPPAGPGVAGGAGTVVNSKNGGGGGGGGGAGIVKAPVTANLGTQVSPLATP